VRISIGLARSLVHAGLGLLPSWDLKLHRWRYRMRLVHMRFSSPPRTIGFNGVVSVFSAMFSYPGAGQVGYVSPLDTHIWFVNIDTTNLRWPDMQIRHRE
jgi:hypothetical protein